MLIFFFFFFNDTATTEIYTLSLHDALPICPALLAVVPRHRARGRTGDAQDRVLHPPPQAPPAPARPPPGMRDRKSTRLNSSHANISYAVFCLKKKKDNTYMEVNDTYHYKSF